MIRPVLHAATGRRFDLADEQPADVIGFLRQLRENLPHEDHGLICETAGGDQRVYVFRCPGEGYSVRHYPGHAHHGDHHVIPESDEHKRGKDWASDEYEHFGLPAAQEVRTNNRTRLDVATLTAPRITGIEIQAHSRLEDHVYKRRTTLSLRATAFTGTHARLLPEGVLPVWVHAFGMPKGWNYPVPSIAAQDTPWDVTPKPGTVTGIGVRRIEPEPCTPGSRWPCCPRTGRNWCGQWHPYAVLRGMQAGEIIAKVASIQLVPLRYHTGAVYLVSPEDITRYADLGGEVGYAPGERGERASIRKLRACNWRGHINAEPEPALLPPQQVPEPPAPRVWPDHRAEKDLAIRRTFSRAYPDVFPPTPDMRQLAGAWHCVHCGATVDSDPCPGCGNWRIVPRSGGRPRVSEPEPKAVPRRSSPATSAVCAGDSCNAKVAGTEYCQACRLLSAYRGDRTA